MRISALPLEALAKWDRFKIILVLVLFTIIYLLVSSSAHAQATTTTSVGSPTNSNARYAPDLNPDVPRDQHSYVQSVVIDLLSSAVCQMGGFDPVRPDHKCLGVDPSTGKLGFVENGGGALGIMSNLIAYTFTPPISTTDYTRYLSSNFGLAKKTYAQVPNNCAVTNPDEGYGFCGIRPILPIWVAMRNIAYLLFVIIFVLIGLAIMFRVHIDPRTVMTIENQIPKIIVGILLVTFSFALAGLLIDVMYVAIYLVGNVLVSSFPDAGINLNAVATSPTPFDAINRLWEGSAVDGGFNGLSKQGGAIIHELVRQSTDGSVATRIDIWDIFRDTLSFITAVIVGTLATFVIFLALIYTAVRLWVILIVAYISILLDIIFAPFWFLIGLFPGSTLGVGAWFKDMLANLAVFPTAIAMFILARIFSTIAFAAKPVGEVPSGLFIPPLAGGGTGAGGEVFAGLVALGFLFMTPHVLNITRGAIKAPAINYGPVFQDPGAALKAGTGIGREIGATRVASREYIPGEGGQWRRRTIREAFTGRTFR